MLLEKKFENCFSSAITAFKIGLRPVEMNCVYGFVLLTYLSFPSFKCEDLVF